MARLEQHSGALSKYRRVIVALLLGRSSVREIIGRERFSRPIFGTGQRLGVAVIGKVGGVEYHRPIEHRKDAMNRPGHLAIPELEVTSELFLPILVEIDDQVQATVEVEPLVLIEIGVHREVAPALNLMEPASPIVRIGDETLDSRERLQKLEDDR